MTTEKDGSYTLTEVAPGPQRVVLQEPNLLTLSELSLNVGERQKMEATDLQVVPKPPGAGLFGPFDDGQAYVGHCHAFTVAERQDRAWLENAPVAEGE